MQTVSPTLVFAEQRMVLPHVSWRAFVSLLENLGDQRAVRLAYGKGQLELMMPSNLHELIRELLGDFVKTWADSLELDHTAVGSWTMRREDLEQGIEPDNCFYIQSVEAVRGKIKFDLAEIAPPDLAIEVDITSSSTLRQPIYQALGVPELWQWTGDALTILHLVEGIYQVQSTSVLKPLTAEKLTELVQYGLANTPSQARRLLRQWLASDFDNRSN